MLPLFRSVAKQRNESLGAHSRVYRVYLKRESTPVTDYAELIIVGVSRPKRRRRCMHSLYRRRANLRARFVMENYVGIMRRALRGTSFPSRKTDNLE